MVFGMATTQKITVTLPSEQIKRIRALVKTRETDNISAYVKHAVQMALDDEAEWDRWLEQALLETGGPLTKKEIEWADSILLGTRRKKKARRSPAA